MKSLLFQSKYTLKESFDLFLVCAFPIHIWALLMAFRDFSWVAERTRIWDAIGLVAYALLIALLESIGVFILVLLLAWLLPTYWQSSKRIALTGSLFLILSAWAMLGQGYFLMQNPLPEGLFTLLAASEHPARILAAIILPLITLSVAIPALLIYKSSKILEGVLQFFERLTLLSIFYLLLDAMGIVVLIVRSLTQ